MPNEPNVPVTFVRVVVVKEGDNVAFIWVSFYSSIPYLGVAPRRIFSTCIRLSH